MATKPLGGIIHGIRVKKWYFATKMGYGKKKKKKTKAFLIQKFERKREENTYRVPAPTEAKEKGSKKQTKNQIFSRSLLSLTQVCSRPSSSSSFKYCLDSFLVVYTMIKV